MEPGISDEVRIWSLHSAPPEFREMFPKGQSEDWIVHVANPELRAVAEHSLLRWRRIFPVEVVELPEGGALYWGAETQGLAFVVKSSEVKSSEVKFSEVKFSEVKSSEVKFSEVSSEVSSTEVSSTQVKSSDKPHPERRKQARVPIACSVRYVTETERRQVGVGTSIDLSESGISFTTEFRLTANTDLDLFMIWPVSLENEIPVELHAVGRLVRAEETKAVLLLKKATFSIAD